MAVPVTTMYLNTIRLIVVELPQVHTRVVGTSPVYPAMAVGSDAAGEAMASPLFATSSFFLSVSPPLQCQR